MRVRRLHRLDLPPRQAARLQRALAGRVVERGPLPRPLSLVAGADCSPAADGRLVAVVVLCAAPDWRPVEVSQAVGAPAMPYLPGLLSFREAPLLLDALRRLEGDPDLLLVDGHGRAHPRGLGIASHLGLHLEIPVVGVGKSLLVGEFASPGVGRGDSAPIRYGGRTNGRAVRTRAGVKPVFVSVGNRISLPSAVRAVLATASRFRLPEPIRHADRESRRHARAPAPSAAPPIAPSRGGVAGRTRCWTA